MNSDAGKHSRSKLVWIGTLLMLTGVVISLSHQLLGIPSAKQLTLSIEVPIILVGAVLAITCWARD